MVTVIIPHVGGPLVGPGAMTVLVSSMPTATLGSMGVCVGPPTSVVVGNFTVLANNKPIARMMDSTAHGGVITVGNPTVLA